MVDARNLIIFLSNLKSYPVNLAKKIGCEKSVLWYHLFTKHGECEFEFQEQFLIGILNAQKLYDDLVALGYLNFKDKYSINFNKIIEECGGATITDLNKPPFTDSEFLTLCSQFFRMLESKGRKVTKKEIYAKFEGKTLEESKAALVLSLNNKWASLFFKDGRDKEHDTRNPKGTQIGGRAWNSGGKQTEGSGRTYKPKDI